MITIHFVDSLQAEILATSTFNLLPSHALNELNSLVGMELLLTDTKKTPSEPLCLKAPKLDVLSHLCIRSPRICSTSLPSDSQFFEEQKTMQFGSQIQFH